MNYLAPHNSPATNVPAANRAATSADDFRDSSVAGRLRLIPIASDSNDTTANLLRDRQMIRIDALKILIGILLDQMNELASATEPTNDTDPILQSLVRRFETELIRYALMRTGGKQRPAARLLGEKKTTLNAKILRYGIKLEEDVFQAEQIHDFGMTE